MYFLHTTNSRNFYTLICKVVDVGTIGFSRCRLNDYAKLGKINGVDGLISVTKWSCGEWLKGLNGVVHFPKGWTLAPR